jgi:hypothetical protein
MTGSTSFLGNISNMFRTSPNPNQALGNQPQQQIAAPVQLTGSQQQGQDTLPSQLNINQPGQPGNTNTINAAPAQESQAIDPLANLWQTDPTKQASNAPLKFDLDPTKLAELAGKLDYTQVVTPELRAKIEVGGPEATSAMLSAMNAMSQVAYQQNAQATTNLIQAAVDAATVKTLQAVDKRLGQTAINGFVQEFNPALNDPKFATLVNATRDQILMQFPNATPTQLTEMVSNYFNDLGIAANPQLAALHKQQQTQQPGMLNQQTAQPDQGIDWLQYAQTNVALPRH